MERRWRHRPEGSTWGDFGPDDQLGRLNLLTPEKVLQGIAEVKVGLRFCLSLPLDLPGGNRLNSRRFPPAFSVADRGGVPNYNFPLSRERGEFVDVVCDDAVTIFTQYSTQWDALCHLGREFDADGDGRPEQVFYNGFRAGTDVPQPEGPGWAGARALGIERMAEAAVQGRGVLVDLHHHFGRERVLVGYDALMRVLEADRVAVEPGDILCLHTGFARVILEMKGDPDVDRLGRSCAVLDGRDERLLEWIAGSGIAALAADNYAVEAYPAREGRGARYPALPLHELCLFRLGVHLGELWYLTELAGWLRQHGRSRFLLTAPPLRLPGAAGSPVTPVATV